MEGAQSGTGQRSMTRAEQNYTPPYFHVIAMFLALSNLLRVKKGDTLSVGWGTTPYLNNFFIGERGGVGEW